MLGFGSARTTTVPESATVCSRDLSQQPLHRVSGEPIRTRQEVRVVIERRWSQGVAEHGGNHRDRQPSAIRTAAPAWRMSESLRFSDSPAVVHGGRVVSARTLVEALAWQRSRIKQLA
jgi:hypothetical protein